MSHAPQTNANNPQPKPRTHNTHAANRAYKNILVEAKLWNTSRWVDMPGNHDAIGVQSMLADNYYAGSYLSWPPARTNETCLEYVYEQDNTLVQIVVMNAVSLPGLALTYMGDMPSPLAKCVQERLNGFQHAAARRGVYAHSYLASHFCFSTISTPSWVPAQKKLLSNDTYFTAHLCGHDHMVDMATRVGSGPLELEVGDVVKHASMRTIALDHGLFSLADKTIGSWPHIVLTNPVPAQLLSETTPLSIMRNSDCLCTTTATTTTAQHTQANTTRAA